MGETCGRLSTTCWSVKAVMQFEFHAIDTLPKLAWCAQITRNNPIVRVVHGPWVETADDFVCEGAWNGEFSKGQFPDAFVYMGSGARLTDSGVLFSSPSHTVERLHVIEMGTRTLVSNSLAFLLVQADDWCDTRYMFYIHDLTSVMKGLKEYKRKIPTAKGNSVLIFYYCNVLIRPDLSLTQLEKRCPKPFQTYAELYDFLRTGIAALHQNAMDPLRKVSYSPLTTISSGYDSPAASVLAVSIGCKDAVTCTQARPGFQSFDDSGREVAKLIGLAVSEFDRHAYLHRDDFPEADFMAAGTGGEDVVMVAFEKLLPGKLFFTGYGGSFWDRNYDKSCRNFERRDASGNSLAEYRLRLGFIHVPVPYIIGVNLPSSNAISNSAEMHPWCTGNGYDRPVARRIVEERGVPRHLFGQQKKAISQPFSQLPLSTIMSKRSYEDFKAFSTNLPLFANWTGASFFSLMKLLYDLNFWINWKVRAAFERLGIFFELDPIIPDRFKHPVTVCDKK